VNDKGKSCYRSTTPRVSDGKHEPIISDDLWKRCQTARANRRVTIKTIKKTSRVNILQGLVVCAYCRRRLRVQTPKNCATYYREDSHLRGYRDCPFIGQSIRAEEIDGQVAELIQSIRLPFDWETMVRKLLEEQHDGTDPETERKEIRGTLRLMRENFERGLYDGEEYIYWQKVGVLKEKLTLLDRVPEPAINRAARTLLDLRGSWEWATKEERKNLVRRMLLEIGCNVEEKRLLWVRARPEYEVLFQLLPNLQVDEEQRYWVDFSVAHGHNWDIKEDNGQMGTEVEIRLQMSHNALTTAEEHIK